MTETHAIEYEGVKLFVTGTYYDKDSYIGQAFQVETVKTRCGDDITALCADLGIEGMVLASIKDTQRGELAENEAARRGLA